jgi:molecular chaperone GrpE (heat shock protein)
MKNHDTTRGREHDPDEIDDVEILEVIGIDDDAPVAANARESRGGADRDIVLAFDEEEAEGARPAGSGSGPTGAPGWGEVPAAAAADADPVQGDAALIQRLRADYENLRKRVDRERADFEHRANFTLVGRLLPILDGFERALTHDVPAGSEAALRDGLVLIHQQLHEALREAGLRTIPVDGELFDPELHEAVATDSRSSRPRNSIVEELRRGYLLRDRVIRHALVKVSTNGGEPGEEGDSA